MEYFNHKKSPLPVTNTVAGVILYFGIYFFLGPYILDFFARFFNDVTKAYYFLELGFYMIVASLMVYFCLPVLKESLNNQKENGIRNFKIYLQNVGWMYLSMIVLNLGINLVAGSETSQNQVAINALSRQFPVLILVLSVFLAPLVEELVFRGLIFRFVREYNKTAAFLFSSILFGGMHVFESLVSGNWLDVMYIVTYSVLGYFLTRGYEKTGSLFTNIAMHMTINGISFLLMNLMGLI